MIQRCTNPKCGQYADYGGRGITVCDRWKKFENFFTDMGAKTTPAHTIDRINNDGNYEPSNCRWATREEQSRNTRVNHFITFEGVTHARVDWAKKLGIHYQTLTSRLLKMPVAEAFKMPVKSRSNCSSA